MTQFPRIHSNGTSADVLIAEYRAAADAVRDAIKAVKAVTVHGRDYYTISSDAGEVAYAEHYQRLNALHRIEGELMAIAVNIMDQKEGIT